MSVSQFTLNLVEGSVSFSFSPQAARDLQSAIVLLMDSLKAVAAKTAGGKASGQKPMEYRYAGDVFFEVFCNPNIWPTPFAAKVLITVRDDRLRVTTEAQLSRLRDDLSQYLEQVG
ncbi:hypothetical protein C7B69_20730 [filamentous cyanobacterium Phorm 46]|nr:hypothetical protein C7B69_20730 [filamentous cyanobacterium Phorm 46]PSB50155.1 hypothetical protein C7B67_15450 [filamentous cyanobacterium Phorm 6]